MRSSVADVGVMRAGKSRSAASAASSESNGTLLNDGSD
jgi:hypothetical protein